MADELRDFMKEGFDCYAEAFGAVNRFQLEIQEVLADVLLGREQWGAFTRTAKPATNAGGRPGKGCWIYATQSGSLHGSSDMLEVGLWWNAPRGPSLVAYANPYWSARDLELLRRAAPGSPVRVLTIDGKARFAIEQPTDGELPAQIERLVDELTAFLSRPTTDGAET